ncbi:MAG TPA: hypothetical protein VGL76_02400 [Gaiellaceae bacterium]
MKRLAIASAAAAVLAVGGFALYADAFQQADGVTLTGCVNSGGELKNLTVGNTSSCAKNETLVHLGNGDITSVQTPDAGGLAGGTDSGDASLSIQPSFRLPQGCKAPSNVPKWISGAWACAGDDNTTYSGADFAVSNQSCADGTFVNAIDAKGKIQCSAAVTITQLATGDKNCATGGLAVTTGGSVFYVCNGATGPTGPAGGTGPQGSAGPQGPAGTVSNAASANGLFHISLTNAGLVLKGPGGTITIDRSAVVVHGTPYANVEGDPRP